jgi:TPR repeat protein
MMLGRYLARKLAGEQNFEEARRWTERAVAQGMQEAKADLAALPPLPAPDGASSAQDTAARAAGD